MDFLNNDLGGCLFAFVMIVASVWYFRPKIFFNDDGSTRYSFGSDNGLNVSLFGVCVVLLAIIIYYIFALFRG